MQHECALGRDPARGLSLLDAATSNFSNSKSEHLALHNQTRRPGALAARAASRFPAQVAAQRPSDVTKGAAPATSRAAGASVASATCKPESKRNLNPTTPAVQISDADRKRKTLMITDKCTTTFKKWREKGESFRVDRCRCIEGRCLHQIMSAKTKVTKTKTSLKQPATVRKRTLLNLSDLKHDLRCGFVELGGSVSVSS